MRLDQDLKDCNQAIQEYGGCYSFSSLFGQTGTGFNTNRNYSYLYPNLWSLFPVITILIIVPFFIDEICDRTLTNLQIRFLLDSGDLYRIRSRFKRLQSSNSKVWTMLFIFLLICSNRDRFYYK